MTRARYALAMTVALFGGAAPGATQTSQQPPATFRAGVDLVVVDVIVVDKSGKPVIDLASTDFSVSAGKRPRRVVSSEFVAVKRDATAVRTMTPGGVPGPTDNRLSATGSTGRSIFFVVDVDEIRAGEGRSAMRAITEYVEGLNTADHVGLIALPAGMPRVDLTTNRQLVREAAGSLAGASRRTVDPEMTPGEASAIAVGDTGALKAWWERSVGLPALPVTTGRCPVPTSRPIEEPLTAPPNCKDKAQRTLDVYRRHTRNILDSLRALAAAMAPLAGQKAIVLVSEGLYNDLELRDDLRRFASAAEQARVSLYAMHLDAPLMEAAAGGASTAASRLLDDRIGFDGMTEVARAARGTAFRVIANAAGVLDRVDAELSGYYLLAFERSADDRDGEHVRIDVKVSRPGLDVRARSEFTPAPLKTATAVTPRRPIDPKAAMGTLLQWPAPIHDVGVDVDTFTIPIDAASAEAKVLIAAEIETGGKAVDVGFEVRDARGKVVADSFEPRAELRSLTDGRALYAVTVSVTPGSYTLALGAIDADGKQGLVRHSFDVKAWPPGALRMSDVLLGEVSGGVFRPAARIGAGSGTIAVRVEAHAASAGAFNGQTVTIDIQRAGETAAALSTRGALSGADGVLRRASTTVVDISSLPRGDYVVRVSLASADGTLTTQASRLFRRE